MNKLDETYQSFLLRLWRNKPDGQWRASVERPGNGRRECFPDLLALVNYLEMRTGERVGWKTAEASSDYIDSRFM
jgi:hypothetical protein